VGLNPTRKHVPRRCGINKVKHKLKWGAKHIVNNGRNTLLWEDILVGEVPLKLVFPKLFEYCKDKHCTVMNCWEGEWVMDFARTLSREEGDQWAELVNKV
jgi:hypothetical protein